ncbi:hypothetical protein JD276_14130 [Leucobacter sp. CSA1]|uniref:DUF7341 domain-containing protein n=1 Tax=Leucobacter chromiisoli TaxID=2796471 RepID=A0A934UW50_9MICO|nr:hypothetical protein [Leucobacter chromiisoli]MBK0420171.1 hypothetical protein [Leucobacter chromiisoli]
MERLTETHTVHYDGAEYECGPLIDQLREALTSSLGAGSGGGGSSDGGLLNLGAFTLWEHIDGIARGWLRSFNLDHRGTLEDVISRLPRTIQAEHANGTIDDDLRERLDAMFGQWVAQIEDLFDPPHQKELTAPCPECGERYHVDGDTQRAAVVIPVKRGRAVVAECRCCGAMWATETALVGLAEQMGIEVDFTALHSLVE